MIAVSPYRNILFHLEKYECWKLVILDVVLNTGLGGLRWNHLDVAHLLQSLHNIRQVGLPNRIIKPASASELMLMRAVVVDAGWYAAKNRHYL